MHGTEPNGVMNISEHLHASPHDSHTLKTSFFCSCFMLSLVPPVLPTKAETGPSQDLPSLAMMHDYAAVMPRTFSHTCSLCKKECAKLKDWVFHQNTTLHHANCKRLRSRDASRSAKTLPPTSLYRHQTDKCDSHSHSCSSSPRGSSSEDIGDKSSSRSRSRSYSPRHHRSSRDGSKRSSSSSCSRSCHHSPRDEKHKSTSNVHLYTPHRSRSRHKRNRSSNSSSAHSGSPSHHWSRDKRNRSNSSSCQRRLQLCISRSRSRSCSPYYDRSALSCYQARSGSSEKQSSPKRMCKKSRNHEQQLSRGRSPERRLSPRSDRKQWSPKKSLERESFLRKTDDKRLSPIGIHIRQPSPRKIDNKRWSPMSGWKKQMSLKRTDDEQWSPKRSLERESSPRKTDGKQWSSKRSLERESSPRKTDDKQLSPIRIRICQSSPRMINDKRCSSMSGWKKEMSLRRPHDRQWSPKRSLERESSPRKTDDNELSPIRIHIRQLSPRKIDDQRWSPTTGWKKQMSSRRTDDKRRSPTRSHKRLHNKRCSPMRNHERQSSPRGTDGKSWSPMRVRVRQSSPKNTDDKWWSLARRTDERRWSPTRSRERQSSPRKNGDKGWSPTTKCEQQLPPKDANLKQWSPTKTYEQRSSPRNTDDTQWSLLRRTDEKLWSPMRSHEHQSSPGRTNDKQGSPARSSEYRRRPGDKPWLPDKSHRQQSFPGRDEEHFVPMQSDEEMSSLRRKRKRHTSLEELSSQKKKSCSIQMLTKRLLKKSAVQSTSRQSNIENVVNLVVPVLLSELAKTQDPSPSLVLPSQAKNRKLLNLSSRGSKSCSSSQSNLPKLEWNPARSSKKLKDNTPKRALSIITQDWRKRNRVKARDGNELDSCENLDLLPIKTLLSLHQKLVRKAKKLSSKGKHIYSSKAHALKTQAWKSVVLNKQPLQALGFKKFRHLGTSHSNQRRKSIVSRKDQDFKAAVKEKTRVKSVTKITVAESKKGKKTVTGAKADCSRTSADKPLDKTAKCSGVTKQIKVEKSPGDKRPSSKPSQKFQPKMVPNPDFEKSKSIEKNPDSGGEMRKSAASTFKKGAHCEVAVTDTTKAGKMLLRTVAEANEGREITEVKVSASKTSSDKKLNKTAKCSGVSKQIKVKESLGDKMPFSNAPPYQPKQTKPLLGKVVTTLDPLQAQEIIKTHETSVKALPKDQPRMVPNSDSKKSKSLGKNPGSGGTIEKLEANPLKKDKESELAAKDTTKVGKMLQRNVAEASKGKEMVTKVKVTASKASADKKLDKAAKCSPEEKLTETNTFAIHTKNSHQPKSKETTPGFSIITSALPVIENSPDGFWPAKHGFSDEANTTTASLSKPEHPQPVSNVATTPDKLADPAQTQQTMMKTPETLVQQKMVLHQDMAALNPKTNGKQLQVQPQSAGSSANALLGAVHNTGQEEGKNCQKDAVLSETQKNQLQQPVGSSQAAGAAITSSDIKAAATPNDVKDFLTVGESMAYYLNPTIFNCVSAESVLPSEPFSLGSKLLLIRNLPVNKDCCYTEEELVNLLSRFEFQYAHNLIYIIPQTGMAFVLMPNEQSVIGLLQASVLGHLTFKEHKLFLYIVKKDMVMTPLRFYRSLIDATPLNMKDDGTSIIYIQNITPSDTIKLREALRSIGSIRNFLPLLNKVFVEFETVYDADRLGVWYSLMRVGFLHTINRLKVPRSKNKSQPPKQPLKALPESEERLSEAQIPKGKYIIPQSTTPPFWVTMITAPYVFPTVCPWFNIPKFLTVRGEMDVLTPPPSASKFSTIMLTGLPEGNYKHEDVVRLVWHYFPKQNLQTLYYNILVLPLQRRAFVFFCDWEACCSFVSDCVKNPVSVGGCPLSVHLVFDDMHPGSSEEKMYRTLMKWSNGYVPEFFLLEKRLLSVETYETNLDLIKSVMKEVAAIASFVSILPLTNRICIEMASASGVAKVLQAMPLRNDLSTYVWSKVGRIECVKDLNRRLKETSEIKINLEAATPEVSAELSALKTGANIVLSEPHNNVAHATSAVPATFIKSTMCTSELKPEDRAAEPPDVVLDSKAETASTTQECQACEKISVVGDPDKKTQTDPLSAVTSVSDMSTEASSSVKLEPPAGLDSCLTAGERIGRLLRPQNIRCLGHNIIMSPKPFSLQSRLLLITDLPQYEDGGYTESDLSDLLHKFGFQYKDKNIYVIPQACMAFALMPSYENAKDVFLAAKQCLLFNGSKLGVEIVSSGILMTPFGFYKSLMETIKIPVIDDGTSTIYIQNISPSEARDLRETLRKIDSVKNYLLLLNKVFIEFESAADADRIGVWYSLLKGRFAHNIYRIKLPTNSIKSLPPRLAAKAMPDSKDIVVGPVVPPTNIAVPDGSTAPFSVTMTTAPFVFPTVSPWFIIPKFRTVNKVEDLLASISVASKFSTVMVTGLPLGTYKHEDVARLVWKYFPQQNLQTLLYNIVVLPLQRRAFVFFNDWQSCHNFVKDFHKKQVSLKGRVLHIHLVLEEMHLGSSEEMMYQALMKWSNARVPELQSLQERLVCLELSEISVNLVMTILEFVTNCSSIVGFLLLANRLCIEMAESRGVNQVVASCANTPEDWNKVRSVESVKSLKQRIKDSSEIKIHLELDTADINAKTPATKTGPQSPPPPPVPVKSLVSSLGTVVPRDETETGSETAPEKKQQAGPCNAEVKEVKAESCVESKGGETADVKPTESLTPTTTVKTQPSKPSNNPHQSPQTNLKTQQTAVKCPSQVQKCLKPNPNLKTKTNVSGISGLVKTNESPASNVSAASAQIGPNKESSATGSDRQTGAAASSTEGSSLTPGEKMQDFLTPSKLCLAFGSSPLQILSLNITLVITDLPQFHDGCYTEADIIDLLQTYGVQCENDKLFVIPQSQMAFFIRPNVTMVQNFFKVLSWRKIIFKESKLSFHVINTCKPMTLFGFYKFLMSFTKFPVKQKNCDTRGIVYFRNISGSEARELREALRRIGSVRNYIPLLNKVFVHCETPLDADRLQVWYCSWKWRHFNYVEQKTLPEILNSSTSPSLATPALPLEDMAVGASGPRTGHEGAPLPTPEFSAGTFWSTMTTSPYIFHTTSPCFNIPAHETVNRKTYVEISQQHLKFPTIMLTSLSNKTFTHEDVAELVWNYFPEQNLHSLYNNIVVLPLQRRAFVFFSSSDACLRFLQNRNMNPVHLKGFIAKIHLVLEDIDLGSSEESMFRTLMKWSNIYVPDLRSLEERLICVEVSGVNEQIVTMVMKEVASIATFVNFLPLANRIYIEMAESTGASKVVQNLSVCTLSEQHKAWKQVGRLERLTCRKNRLKDCRKIAVKLEQGTMTAYTEGTPLTMPTKSPQLLCRRMDEESVTCSALPDGSLLPSDKGTEHPQIDLGILKTLKEVILQHKHERRRSTLMKEISSESSSKPESSSSSKQTTKEMQSSCLSSATEDISESAKECKSSASSSGSTKRSLSSSSLSLSVKTKKHTLESTKSQTNPSSFADGSETVPSLSSSKSGKSLASSGEKDLSNKTETSLRASPQPSTSTGRNTCSSSTSAETSQSDKNKRTGAAIANGDHEVSAESCTPKTQSDSKLVKSSEASPAAQGQNLEFTNEIQNQENFKDKTLKEATEGKEDLRESNVDVKSPVKEGPDHESYQITDSVTGQKDKQNWDTETPGTEKSQILCREGLQVSENVEDSKKALNKPEMETFLDAKDNATKKEFVAVEDENRLAKNEGSTVKPDQKIKASTGEEGETLSIKQESSVKLLEIQTMDSSAETGTSERTEEMGYKDSVSPTQWAVGRSNRGAKQDETNQHIVATDEQTITTRSARKRMENTEKDSSDGRKNNTPRQRRNIPTRDSQEQNKDKSPKGEEELPAIDVTPTTCEQKPTQEISDELRETKEEHKEVVTRRKRGRPKKMAGLPPVMTSTIEIMAENTPEQMLERFGRRTRSSSAAVKRSVEAHQSQENEPKPAERAGVKSGRKVTTERKNAKTVPVLDPPGLGQESEVHKAETPKSSLKNSLQVSHSINNEVQICSQSVKDAKEKEIATDDHEASLQEEKHLVKDEGLAVKPSQETRASKSEDGENSDKQPETQTKNSNAGTETDNGAVEMVCKESVKNKSGKERSFSHNARLAKQIKTNEDKAATNAPAVTTRSTSRRRKITEKDSTFERKKDKTLTRRRTTNPGDSQHQNKGKTQKTEEEMLPKDDTPVTCEQKPPQEILEDVNFTKNGEEEKEAATKRKRGRPKKTAGPSPVRYKRKMEFSGPEPKRSHSRFARVDRHPPYKPHRKTSGRSHMKL
ncbi:hypothetical protein CRENBAI_016477 [Crenichthys baileyi]|uniref:Matrin-type domain-containing protein n=1 Tax=Crenichthys baileyi TaxID=28760 RepID=A0AAV9SB79_9TELE